MPGEWRDCEDKRCEAALVEGECGETPTDIFLAKVSTKVIVVSHLCRKHGMIANLDKLIVAAMKGQLLIHYYVEIPIDPFPQWQDN